MADLTDNERKAVENQKAISKYNADSTKQQFRDQAANYDAMDMRNRDLADVQLKQNSRKLEADRFDTQRDLQNAALGNFGAINQAANGSTMENFKYMLGNRNDKDNMTHWTQHQQNQNAVENAYQESYNQNQAARNDLAINTAKILRDNQADLSANLSNIDPDLYEEPGTGSTDLGIGDLNGLYKPASGSADSSKSSSSGYDASLLADENRAQLSGYMMPENSVQRARRVYPANRLGGTDHWSRMINSINGR